MKQLFLFILFFPIFVFSQKNNFVSGKDNVIGKNLSNIRLERCTSVIVTNDAIVSTKNKPLKLKNKSFVHYNWDGFEWISDAIDSTTLIHKSFEHGKFSGWFSSTDSDSILLPQYSPVLDTVPAIFLYSDCDTCVLKNKRGYVSIDQGMLSVVLDDSSGEDEFKVHQECTSEEESQGLLQVIYEDGKFFNQTSLTEVRNRLK